MKRLLAWWRRWRAKRACKKHGHDWAQPFAVQLAEGWRYVEVCQRCEFEQSAPLGRRSRRRGKVIRSDRWKNSRSTGKSAMKGIATTDGRRRMAKVAKAKRKANG